MMAAAENMRPRQPEATAPAAEEGSRSPGPTSELAETPLREVPLSVLHKRSSPLGITNSSLAHGLDSARRLDALEWLVQAFDALNLPDAQLFCSFGLLDRYAAASPTPISAGPGAFALVLAAMLIALKVSGTKKDLERAKRLVIEVSGSSRPWTTVRKAELHILRRLNFRACTPTANDLLERLLSDNVLIDSEHLTEHSLDAWDPESKQRCQNLARFLLELAIVHDSEAIYGAGRAPLAGALAAVLLSLLALGAPKRYAEGLSEGMRLADLSRAAVTEIAEAMRQRWSMEEQKSSGNSSPSAVTEKWLRREGSLGASPPSPGELRHLTTGITVAATTAKAVDTKSFVPAKAMSGAGSPPAKGSSTRRSVGHGAGNADMIAALPTPARRASIGVHSTGQAAAAAAPVPPSQPPQRAPQSVPNPRHSQKDPKPQMEGPPAEQQPLKHLQPEEEQKEEQKQPRTQLSRAAAQENLSYWPLTSGTASAASNPADGADVPASCLVQDRSPEPLVELTQVLNLVAPRPQPATGSTAAAASAACPGKFRPPSVAAELLVSSALRMQWPVDKRKLPAKDAAGTCREAAAVLQEAVAQLTAAAAAFEGGSNSLRDFTKTRAGAADITKRRRTFAGQSQASAMSPPVAQFAAAAAPAKGQAPVQRGSPPVTRTGGLRV
eukprot:TRINITY_DN109633_c0_g1_i1.p1 TRINITY_DN109633_c0_g1~~TRINITY_DN109633_c0_g1_i1.p1  ORF type:complete len:668 (+),score=155.64 TRINITY_DN109633_c0_g1_i1:74-2077(+)